MSSSRSEAPSKASLGLYSRIQMKALTLRPTKKMTTQVSGCAILNYTLDKAAGSVIKYSWAFNSLFGELK